MSGLGIKSRLLKSVVTLTVFYGLIGIFIYFSTPSSMMMDYLELIDLEKPEYLNAQNQLFVFLNSMEYQSIEVGRFILLGFLFALVATITLVVSKIERRSNLKKTDSWEGMSATYSYSPRPAQYQGPVAEVSLTNVAIKEGHQQLLDELIGYTCTYEHHYIGSGHGDVGLLEHTLNVINKAISYESAHSLLVLGAAAHDLGKSITFKQDEGEWVRMSPTHDIESAQILRMMPAWGAMPEAERLILMFAVKYQHHPDKLPLSFPSLTEQHVSEIHSLMNQLIEIDGQSTKEEKEVTIEEQEIPLDQQLYNSLESLLKTVTFSGPSTARSAKTSGFRYGRRVYIFEYAMREFLKSYLTESLVSALDLDTQVKNRVCEGMIQYFKVMSNENILIDEHICPDGRTFKVPDNLPLWDISVGDKSFNAMIILEIPDKLSVYLPEQTKFQVTVKSPYKITKSKLISQSNEPVKPIEEKPIKEMPAKQKVRPSQSLTLNSVDDKPLEPKRDRKEVVNDLNTLMDNASKESRKIKIDSASNSIVDNKPLKATKPDKTEDSKRSPQIHMEPQSAPSKADSNEQSSDPNILPPGMF